MKIAVIGAGAVGVGVCNYVIGLGGGCSELVLIDKNAQKAEGEILDFGHANSLTFSKNIRLRGGDDYALLAGADMVVITAGAQLKDGQTRLDLADINAQITVEIAKQVEQHAPEAILLMVTNPCDITTHFVIKNTQFPASRVISLGCIIDTARLMKLVSDRVNVDPKNVSGYILGEHGANCFMPWGLVGVGGMSIDDYCRQHGFDTIEPGVLLESVKQAGFEIFYRKHNTTHGIAASVFRLVQAIGINEHSVLPVGSLLKGEHGVDDVVLSLPTVINRRGVEKVLSLPLSADEQAQLTSIAATLKSLVADVAERTGLQA